MNICTLGFACGMFGRTGRKSLFSCRKNKNSAENKEIKTIPGNPSLGYSCIGKKQLIIDEALNTEEGRNNLVKAITDIYRK